jgi:transcriptional regulator with XRE-family HTH domain
VTTDKAIATLREKMGLTQQEFAKQLGVRIESVSRYENGREPSRTVLKKLSGIAQKANLSYLADIFTAKWRAGIISRVENLPSAGSQRRVAVDDLDSWLNTQRLISGLLKELVKQWDSGTLDVNDRDMRKALVGMSGFLGLVAADLEMYLKGQVPKKRPLTEEERAALDELYIDEDEDTKGEQHAKKTK